MSNKEGEHNIPEKSSRTRNLSESLDDDFVREVLQSGVDLRSYSSQVEKELKTVVDSSVQDLIKESENIADLHSQINDCDKILERLEGILCSFQADLGNICQEILSLQEESVSLNIRLKNKQAVRGDLSQFIDDIIIPESVMTNIIGTAASEALFLDNLIVLDQKIAFVSEQTDREAPSVKDVMDILVNLKLKAVSKIREYILKKIQSCKKAMTNYQILQNALLKNKFFFKFLQNHDQEAAKDILAEYVDTMSKVYFSYFKEYLSRLSKLKFEEQPDREDTMASEENTKTRSSLFSSKPVLKNRSSIFSLGDRSLVLTTDLESPLIVPHAAVKMEAKYPLEALFRSHQFALVDNACREYIFLNEFFLLSVTQTQQYFSSVMTRTLNLFVKSLEEEVDPSYDCVGLFICLHIIYRYRLLAHKRAVPALDPYFESLTNIIWPRFQHIFHMHINSVKDCDTNRLSSCDTRPHFITRRYAEFSAAIITVNDTFPDERVSVMLGQLQTEVENFILKMASRFDSPKEQLIFLINNYDMILSVLLERSKEDCKESECIKGHLSKRVHDFVDELLYPHFGAMIAFVKDCEAYIERKDEAALQREEAKVSKLIKSFNNSWRKAMEDMNREVMVSFTNFKCGNNITQTALTQVIQYYHRFDKIISSHFKQNASRTELMNIHQLMVEIKKYKTNF